MLKWKCTVCDYIAEGEQAPDICPVCGASKDAFIKIDEKVIDFDLKKILKFLHLHPISVHFQNGLLPVTVLFLIIFFLNHDKTFEKAAFYVYTVSVLGVPITFASGILDWYLRYDMVRANIFTEKIILTILLIIIAIPVIMIRLLNPEIFLSQSYLRFFYSSGIFIQVGLVFRLGFLGGKLVFS